MRLGSDPSLPIRGLGANGACQRSRRVPAATAVSASARREELVSLVFFDPWQPRRGAVADPSVTNTHVWEAVSRLRRSVGKLTRGM